MRIIIAGSRTVTETQLRKALEWCPWIDFVSCVISGGAKGADQFGERWANETGLEVKQFLADWDKFGRRAGPLRNKVMADHAHGLLAVWDGSSRGTASMIELAKAAGLRIYIVRTDIDGVREILPSGSMTGLWERAEESAGMRQFSGGQTKAQAEREAGKAIARAGSPLP